MQKTKCGISVGLFGAAIYFMGLFGGYLVAVLLTGYVLLFEENEWLRKNAVKAVSVMVFFSFILVIVEFIPSTISFFGYIASMFGGNCHIAFISDLVNAVICSIDILEKILFVVLGVRALSQGTIRVPIVDKLINRYMG